MRRLLSALLAAAALLVAAPVGATGTLDQSQPAFDSALFPGCTVWFGQTFTAGLTGALDQVDLPLGRESGAPGPLTVQLRTAAGGLPGATVLASAVVPQAEVPASSPPAFRSVPFAAPAAVVAGTPYAVVLGAPGACSTSTADDYSWGASTADVYAGGGAAGSSDGGATWVPGRDLGTLEFAFKIYVVPPTPPFAQRLTDLQTAVGGVGPGKSLADKVAEARTALAAGNTAGACGTLADFVAQVRAQAGKSIPAGQAQALVAEATGIRTQLGCA